MSVHPWTVLQAFDVQLSTSEVTSLLKRVPSLIYKQSSQLKAHHEAGDSDTVGVRCSCGFYK